MAEEALLELQGLLSLCPPEVLQEEILPNLYIKDRLLISLCGRNLFGSALLWKDITTATIHMKPLNTADPFGKGCIPVCVGRRLLRFFPKLAVLRVLSPQYGADALTLRQLIELLRLLPDPAALKMLDLTKCNANYNKDTELEPELLRLLSGVKRVLLPTEYSARSSHMWFRLSPEMHNLEVILYPMRIEGRVVKTFDLAGVNAWINAGLVRDPAAPNDTVSLPASILGKSWFQFWNLLCIGLIMPSHLSVLHVACAIANVDVVKKVIETFQIQDLNQQLDTETSFSFTPLHMAIGCANLDVIKYLVSLPQVDLLNRKCCPKLYPGGGVNALMLAAGLHLPEALEILLDCSVKNNKVADCFYDMFYFAQRDIFRETADSYSFTFGQNEGAVSEASKKTLLTNQGSMSATVELLMKYMPQFGVTLQTTRQAATGRSLMFTVTSKERLKTFMGAGLSLYDRDCSGVPAVAALAEFAARNPQTLQIVQQLIVDDLIHLPEPDTPEIRAFIRLIYNVSLQAFPLLDWKDAVLGRASTDDLNQTWPGGYSWENERSLLYCCVANREPAEVISGYLRRGAKITRAICGFLSDHPKNLTQLGISDDVWRIRVNQILPFLTADLSAEPQHSNGNHDLLSEYALCLMCRTLWDLDTSHPRYQSLYNVVQAAIGYLKRAQAAGPVILALQGIPSRYSELRADLKILFDEMVAMQLAIERSSDHEQDEVCPLEFLEDQAAL